MFKYVVFYTFSILSMLSSAASAAEDCAQYTVVRGDTLRLIAERYYGTRELSPVLYEANMAVVGRDPNTIEIGMELVIPCRPGIQAPLPSAFLEIIAEPETAGENAPMRFLARAGNTPFMNQDSDGIIPDILGAALRKGGYRAELEVERLGNNAEILQISGQDEGVLLSFPWVLPNCGNPAALSAESEILCENYEFSLPLYEITLGFFVRGGDALAGAAQAADFAGKPFCIPQFYNDDLLRSTGIIGSGISLTYANDFNTCAQYLLSGEIDVIVADYQSLRVFYGEQPSEIVDVPVFAKQTTLHAIAWVHNPEALNVLEIANAGMRQILASGEWFAIVQQHLPVRVN